MKEIKNDIQNDVKIKKASEYKGFKVALGLIIAVLAILIIVPTTVFSISHTINHVDEAKANKIMISLMKALMPDEIESEDGRYKFYVEDNEEFDVQIDEPIEALKFYYIGANDEKIYLDDGIYYADGQEMMVTVGFMYETMQNVNVLKNIAVTTSIIMGIALIFLFIWIAYYPWVVNEEKKALASNDPSLNTKNKKSK